MTRASFCRCRGFRSVASRCQIAWRYDMGQATESMPSRLTPRSRNGMTVPAKFMSGHEAAEGDVAAVPGGADEAAERRSAYGVHRACPGALEQRARLRVSQAHVVAAENLAGAELSQQVVLFGLAGAGGHGISLLGQEVHGNAPYPAGGAGDQNRPLIRRRAVALHGQQAHGRRKPRGAERHGLEIAQGVGHFGHPGSRHAGVFGVPAEGTDAEVVAGDHHPLPYPNVRRLAGDDGSGGIHAGYVRILPHHPTPPGAGQPILVVQGRIRHFDGDLTGSEDHSGDRESMRPSTRSSCLSTTYAVKRSFKISPPRDGVGLRSGRQGICKRRRVVAPAPCCVKAGKGRNRRGSAPRP